jgi:hypothetical protein
MNLTEMDWRSTSPLPTGRFVAWRRSLVAAITVAAVCRVVVAGFPSQSARSAGTASISGRILAGDSGKPLKQARVTLSGGDTSTKLSTHSDRLGRYEFSNLPRGQYTVAASKRGYVGAVRGQGRLRGIGTPIPLSDGRDSSNNDFTLPRGGAIAGRVIDWDGDEVVEARVHAMRAHWTARGMRLIQSAAVSTDDRGAYRLYGLDAGMYYVVASVTPDGGRVEPEGTYRGELDEATFGSTYYPSATSVAEAGRVVVGISEEVLGIDTILQPTSYGRVEGLVVAPRGVRGTGALVHFFGGDAETWELPLFSLVAREDGTFSSDRVRAGTYTAVAYLRGNPGAFGRGQVTVAAGQVQHVRLSTLPAHKLTGALMTEAGALEPSSMTRIGLVPLGPVPPGAGLMAQIQGDGSFVVNEVAPGKYLLEVTGLPRPYVLKSVFAGGDDLSDSPLEVGGGSQALDLRVIGTARGSELTGRVLDGAGNPVRDCTVLAFGKDVVTWRQGGRRAVRVLSDTKGSFVIRGLPAGDYYVAALADVEDGQWHDPVVLERVRRSTTRTTIADGGKVTRDVTARGLAGR